jgi:hypothetical protein
MRRTPSSRKAKCRPRKRLARHTAADSATHSNAGALSFEELENHLRDELEKVSKRAASKGEDLEAVAKRVADSIPGIVDEIAHVLERKYAQDSAAFLRGCRMDNRQFVKRHLRIWKPALDLFEMLLQMCTELGSGFNERFRPEAAENHDCLFEALTLLHSRSCQVGREVLVLLSSGLADGAHARWRTLHELAVTATLIQRAGGDIAERYLLHDHVIAYKGMKQYQEHVAGDDPNRFSQQELDAAKQTADDLITRFEKSFSGDYGWAAGHLELKKPTFFDLEKSAAMGHVRPYYRWASQNVHAGVRGSRSRLGLRPQDVVLLAGPSNFGLADPGHGAAISLSQVTAALIQLQATLDVSVHLKVVMDLVDRIGETFLAIHKSIEEDSPS